MIQYHADVPGTREGGAQKSDEPILIETLHHMKKIMGTGYSDPYCSINLCDDASQYKQVKALCDTIGTVDTLVVIGIGGSNLGTKAILEAVHGTYHNESHKIQVHFADTTDEYMLSALSKIIRSDLKNKKRVLINAISKSGTTVETLANLSVLMEVVREFDKNHQKHVVLTTDAGSSWEKIAKEAGYYLLAIPYMVGGRYSAFSPVGLFPLALAGIDIKKLLDGAKLGLKQGMLPPEKNIAIRRACIQAVCYHDGLSEANYFVYANQLESLGKWYRQLLGESIGKTKLHDEKTRIGITPTVTVGSTDLHSMAQLYLTVPIRSLHTFVIPTYPERTRISKNILTTTAHIANKHVSAVMEAIYGGVLHAWRKRGLPFTTIHIDRLDETHIGELMQLHMMEIMFLAKLLGVNAFDQPNVEGYKTETRRILQRG